MKKSFTLFFICLAASSICLNVFGQNTDSQAKKTPPAEEPKYEMKQYWFVMLTRGSRRNEITDTTVINKLQEGHMKNMSLLASQGKLVLAGPFADNGDWRGLFILNAASKEEAEGYLKTDPAIAAGRFGYEIHPWWTAKNCHFK